MNNLPPVRTKLVPKLLKNAQDLLEFAISNILSMPNSVLTSNTFFMKYLPSVRSKLVPKLKMIKFY